MHTYAGLISQAEDLSPSRGCVFRCEEEGGEGEWGGCVVGREEGWGGEGGSRGSSVSPVVHLLGRVRGRDGGGGRRVGTTQ